MPAIVDLAGTWLRFEDVFRLHLSPPLRLVCDLSKSKSSLALVLDQALGEAIALLCRNLGNEIRRHQNIDIPRQVDLEDLPMFAVVLIVLASSPAGRAAGHLVEGGSSLVSRQASLG